MEDKDLIYKSTSGSRKLSITAALMLAMLVLLFSCKKKDGNQTGLWFALFGLSLSAQTGPTPPPPAPNAYDLPIEVAVVSMQSSAEVKWKPVTGVTSYSVSVNGTEVATGLTGTSTTLNGLANGRVHAILVSGTDAAGIDYSGTIEVVPSAPRTYISFSPIRTGPLLFDGLYYISLQYTNEGAVSTDLATWKPLPHGMSLSSMDYFSVGTRLYFLKTGTGGFCYRDAGSADIYCSPYSLNQALSETNIFNNATDGSSSISYLHMPYYNSAAQTWHIMAEIDRSPIGSPQSYSYIICTGSSPGNFSACTPVNISSDSLDASNRIYQITNFHHVSGDIYIYCAETWTSAGAFCKHTVDAGQTWSSLPDIDASNGHDYTLRKLNNGNILLYPKSNVFGFTGVSADNGASWTAQTADATYVDEYGRKYAYLDPLGGTRFVFMYVTSGGTHYSGGYRSTDLISWTADPIYSGGAYPASYTIQFIKAYGGTNPPVLVRLRYGSGSLVRTVSRSVDDGATWTDVLTNSTSILVAYQSYLYAYTSTGLQYSADKGATWNPVTCVNGSRTCPASATDLSFGAYATDPADIEPPVLLHNTADSCGAGRRCMFLVDKADPTRIIAFGYAGTSSINTRGVYDAGSGGYLFAQSPALWRFTYVNSSTDFSYLNLAASPILSSSGATCNPTHIHASPTAWYMGGCATSDMGGAWVDLTRPSSNTIVTDPINVQSVSGAQIATGGGLITSSSFETWSEHKLPGIAPLHISQAAGDSFFYIVGLDGALVKMPIYTNLSDY